MCSKHGLISAGEPNSFRGPGLIAVYLGVESGSPDGFRTLSKRVTVERNLAAVDRLKRIGVTFNMGFMPLDPDQHDRRGPRKDGFPPAGGRRRCLLRQQLSDASRCYNIYRDEAPRWEGVQ